MLSPNFQTVIVPPRFITFMYHYEHAMMYLASNDGCTLPLNLLNDLSITGVHVLVRTVVSTEQVACLKSYLMNYSLLKA